MSTGGTTGRVLGLLDEHGALSVREIADQGGISPVIARSASRKLLRGGLVRVENDER